VRESELDEARVGGGAILLRAPSLVSVMWTTERRVLRDVILQCTDVGSLSTERPAPERRVKTCLRCADGLPTAWALSQGGSPFSPHGRTTNFHQRQQQQQQQGGQPNPDARRNLVRPPTRPFQYSRSRYYRRSARVGQLRNAAKLNWLRFSTPRTHMSPQI
jgi:hypothetical protein